MKLIDFYNELGKLITSEPGAYAYNVYLSSDEEGNSYREANIDGISWFCSDDGWGCEVAPEDVGTEYDEDELERAVIVW